MEAVEQGPDLATAAIQPRGDTVLAALARALAAVPDKVFLDFEGDLYTYAAFDDRAGRLAAGFVALGVRAGDVVSSILDNNVDCLAVWIAANRIGAIWAPVNTALVKDFLQSQLSDSGAALVVCEARYFEALAHVAGELPALRQVLVRGERPEGGAGAATVDLLDTAFADAPVRPVETGPADIACILYTSGTTGPSKGCMISQNYLCSQSTQSFQSTPILPGDTVWTPMPLFHIGALTGAVVPALLLQERAAIASRFSVSGFWPEIERSGARVAMVLASMIPLLATAPDNDAMLRCRGQVHSVWGLPFTPETRRVWQERFGVRWINSFGFGMTEGGKIFTAIPGTDLPPVDSQGRLTAEFDAIIADDDDREVPPGTVGEILYRPKLPNIMFSGYWKRPEATAAAWRNLWMHSGDLGKVDAEGNFYFVGRKKDSIRRRGENISTFECELVFQKHPALKEAVVHPVPSPLGEDDVKVTAILREGENLTEEALCRWSIERFPYFAVPRYYEFREDIPRTPTGKPLKYVLRDEGCTPATWDIEASGITVARR